MTPPEPRNPDSEKILEMQKQYRDQGAGRVLDVGVAGWFLIRWANGAVNQECKIDLHILPDDSTTHVSRTRPSPTNYVEDVERHCNPISDGT